MLANNVKETTITTGIGVVTLAGAAVGFNTFSSQFIDGVRVEYLILDGNGNYEEGRGVYSGGTITRETVRETRISGTINHTRNGTAITLSGVAEVLVSPTIQNNSFNYPAFNEPTSLGYSGIPNPFRSTGNAASVTLVANMATFAGYYVSVAGLYDKSYIRIYTTSGVKMRVALWDINTKGLPGVKLAETNNIDTSTTGEKIGSFIAPIYLPLGWVLFCLLSSGSPSIDGMRNAGGTVSSPLGDKSSGGFDSNSGYKVAVTSGWTSIPNLSDPGTPVVVSGPADWPYLRLGLA